jgi:hypothetical protein
MPEDALTLLQASGWNSRHPAARSEMQRLVSACRVPLPGDFLEVMQASDGFSVEGFANPLIVYSIREILQLRKEGDYYNGIPDGLLIGGDGGGLQYVLDFRERNPQGGFDYACVDGQDLLSPEYRFAPRPLFHTPLRLGGSFAEMIVRLLRGGRVQLEFNTLGDPAPPRGRPGT